MKSTDQHSEARTADNARHEQEDVASRDFEKQRNAAAKEMQAKPKKSKKPDSK